MSQEKDKTSTRNTQNANYPARGYPPQQGYSSPGQQPAPPKQPTANWVPIPKRHLNCPPGLEYLSETNQLLVHQYVQILEVITGFEQANIYSVRNSLGQEVYFSQEISDWATRNIFSYIRPFDMKITDNSGREVIHLRRPLAGTSWLTPCLLQSMDVWAPPETPVGRIEQRWHYLPRFIVKNASDEIVMQIKGPCWRSRCIFDVPFRVMSADGRTEVGRISKKWSGLARELFTDADFFGISFPVDLDVRMKAVLLGALFLIVSIPIIKGVSVVANSSVTRER